MEPAPPPLLWLVAGEASGDALGAALIDGLRALRPGLRLEGIGGPQMQARGLVSLFPMEELSLMGFAEVVPRIPSLLRRMRQAEAAILAARPALLVTIDAPGFTLRLAGRVRPKGIRVVHYVAPQVWAWRQGRVKGIARTVDRLLCLLPFEPEFFRSAGIDAHFVGHPAIERTDTNGDGPAFRARHGIAPDAKLLLLLPGSRRQELARLGPIYADAVERVAAKLPGLVPVLLPAPTIVTEAIAMVRRWNGPKVLVAAPPERVDVLAAATAALCKSGTATLDLALASVPMVVAYRLSPVTAAIARRLVRVRYASLVNLLSGSEVVPERIQDRCTGAELSDAVLPLLTDPAAIDAQRSGFQALRSSLTPPGGSPGLAAARAVLELLDPLPGPAADPA